MTQASRPQKNASTSFLDDLIKRHADDLLLVDTVIAQSYTTSLPVIRQIGNHHFQAGGKRIRPLLTLLVAKALSGKIDRAANLAACIELIHSASLIHDDVLDGSQQRRGKASINALWDNRISILTGDYLFSQAFACMVEDGDKEVFRILAKASTTITQGELRQISLQRNLSAPLSEYEKVIEEKTASLFQAACLLGGVAGKANTQQREALNIFGLCFGRIFQFIDDYLDYMGQEEKLGKRLCSDLQEGKITFPLLYIYQKGTKEEKKYLETIISEDYALQGSDKQRTLQIMQQHKLHDALSKLIEADYQKAIQALMLLPETPHRETLFTLVRILSQRQS